MERRFMSNSFKLSRNRIISMLLKFFEGKEKEKMLLWYILFHAISIDLILKMLNKWNKNKVGSPFMHIDLKNSK